jgi:carbon dioxide concentrating mechanism protein CcmM
MCCDHEGLPCPQDLYAYFAGPNPVTSFNPESIAPSISESAFIGPFSAIIGDVTIRDNVFIAPLVSVRADEGTPFFIGSNVNLQDGVILHGIKQSYVTVDGKQYSIHIADRVSCAHRCLVHGPCGIGKNTFVGFNAIVYDALVGEGCYIGANALVSGGVIVPPLRYVGAGTIVDTQAEADALPFVSESQAAFALDVQKVNREFPAAYARLFGLHACSCGLV